MTTTYRIRYNEQVIKKTCIKCGQSKDTILFPNRKANKDGIDSACKECKNSPRRGKSHTNTWYPRYAITRHGLSLDLHAQMLREQNHSCAVCLRPFEKGKPICIDHDHSCCNKEASCGKCIRGLLCSRCNKMLGFACDTPSTLHAAAAYLENRRGKPAGPTGLGTDGAPYVTDHRDR